MTFTGARYHLGTAAFGSLVIAIVQIIRAMLAYTQAKLEAMTRSSTDFVTRLAKALMCCCQCCLCCLEKVLKFISSNACVRCESEESEHERAC